MSAPVFGYTGKHWSIGSIVRGSWWKFTDTGAGLLAEEISIVGTVARLHSVGGKWIATLHYNNEDVGDGVPFEFPVEQIRTLSRPCGL